MTRTRRGVLFPHNKRLELDGGLNNKFERSIIADNESPDCLNVIYSNGAVETREGITKITTSGVGTHVFDGLFTRRDNTGAETMIAGYNGTFHDFQTNTFVTISSSESIFTTGINFTEAQYEGQLFIGQSGHTSYKWNGTDFTRHGVYSPTSALTGSSKNAGLLDGDYQWKMTYVNSQLVESDVNSASDSLSIASGTVSLACLPIAPQSWGVSTRNLYRTVSSGTTFLRVTSIANNTDTTYEDDTSDANLGTEAPTDQGVPPKYGISIYYRDRLFVNDPENPNYVWYSELANPYVFKATNFWRMGDNTTDVVTSFGIIQNTLVVFGQESFQLVYMSDTTPANWSFISSERNFGCKSPQGVVNFQGRILFPAIQNDQFVGFANLTGAGIEPSVSFLTVMNAGSELQSDRIEPDIFQMQRAYLTNISSIVYKNKAYVSVTYGQGQETNNRIYIYDFSIENVSKAQRFTWTPWTGVNAQNFTILDGELHCGTSDGSGHVNKMNDGTYSDNGGAIDSYVWTKEFGGNPGDDHFHKDFRESYSLVELAGAFFMNVTLRIDGDSAGSVQQIDLSSIAGIWDTSEWDVDIWSGGAEQAERVLTHNDAGKRVQFKFDNQNVVNQWFKLHAFGFKYNRKGLR